MCVHVSGKAGHWYFRLLPSWGLTALHPTCRPRSRFVFVWSVGVWQVLFSYRFAVIPAPFIEDAICSVFCRLLPLVLSPQTTEPVSGLSNPLSWPTGLLFHIWITVTSCRPPTLFLCISSLCKLYNQFANTCKIRRNLKIIWRSSLGTCGSDSVSVAHSSWNECMNIQVRDRPKFQHSTNIICLRLSDTTLSMVFLLRKLACEEKNLSGNLGSDH